MTGQKFRYSIVYCGRIGILLLALSFSLFAQGKNPVILIPGLAGSELRHKDTNAKIWFKTFKSKSEDLRLPIFADPTKNHDNLIATDVVRTVKIGRLPVFDVYGSFIKAMADRGGYHEEKWDAPSAEGFKDSLYLFAYDWRLDNVGNARLLVRKINALKLKLKKPDLKFDVVAHSMGGLIARYATMYGDADLPAAQRKPQPTWAGARYFDKIILLGTPNEGSASAINALVNGYSLGNVRVDLPFVQDSSKFTAFTIPAVYELLPAPGTLKAFDEKLAPINIDIFDPKTWSKYGWVTIGDKNFVSHFNASERKVANLYFAAALNRGRRLHDALAAANGNNGGVAFYAVGAECKTALDAIVIYHDDKGDKWKTIFRPKEFTSGDGRKIKEDELKGVMLSPGDGIVTRRSLEAVTESGKAGVPSVFGSRSDKFFCEDHNKLATNAGIQDYVIGVLSGKPEATKVAEEK